MTQLKTHLELLLLKPKMIIKCSALQGAKGEAGPDGEKVSDINIINICIDIT